MLWRLLTGRSPRAQAEFCRTGDLQKHSVGRKLFEVEERYRRVLSGKEKVLGDCNKSTRNTVYIFGFVHFTHRKISEGGINVFHLHCLVEMWRLGLTTLQHSLQEIAWQLDAKIGVSITRKTR
ncbi:uncharacterized protein P174DRAFT_59819 [Aspergillus novofumigatus IBT 16806]|uniref:Uncharacterized protein n=1 Tax=Aspergillus novofumigatus (strain IBT 16806) TaxID=1392255 RepID=A0A2I1BU00_ASPN1|nr:uncharacterized protein P174DRAFT_59819 [Aspergillus novofumigatus IBT 16806]PKX88883.1 hypothetical protein P174DRAFT_59819 [Aspergillus novofumigatus IBT 16806]